MAEQSVLECAGLLRQLRAEARLTQEELADAAGLSPRSVSDLERGINRTARKDTAELLARALDLAEPARAVFVAAARGRAPAAEVLAAVRGEASPASERPAPGESLVRSGCPYPGLVPFEERDTRVFYGRGEMVAQLPQRLAERLDGAGILLVAGESGAGKSSLLRAGLMPWLAAGALGPGSERWPRRVIRPTASPLRELAMQPGRLAAIDAATTRWRDAPTRYPPLPATSAAFLDTAHHAARRNIRRRRSGVAILALLTVLAVVASGFACYQRAAAVQQRDQAIYNQVVAKALQLGTSDTALAAQLNLAAYRLQPTQDLAWRLVNTEIPPAHIVGGRRRVRLLDSVQSRRAPDGQRQRRRHHPAVEPGRALCHQPDLRRGPRPHAAAVE